MHYFNTLAAWNDISGGPSVASFAKAAVMRSVRFVCHSVCLSLSLSVCLSVFTITAKVISRFY